MKLSLLVAMVLLVIGGCKSSGESSLRDMPQASQVGEAEEPIADPTAAEPDFTVISPAFLNFAMAALSPEFEEREYSGNVIKNYIVDRSNSTLYWIREGKPGPMREGILTSPVLHQQILGSAKVLIKNNQIEGFSNVKEVVIGRSSGRPALHFDLLLLSVLPDGTLLAMGSGYNDLISGLKISAEGLVLDYKTVSIAPGVFLNEEQYFHRLGSTSGDASSTDSYEFCQYRFIPRPNLPSVGFLTNCYDLRIDPEMSEPRLLSLEKPAELRGGGSIIRPFEP